MLSVSDCFRHVCRFAVYGVSVKIFPDSGMVRVRLTEDSFAANDHKTILLREMTRPGTDPASVLKVFLKSCPENTPRAVLVKVREALDKVKEAQPSQVLRLPPLDPGFLRLVT